MSDWESLPTLETPAIRELAEIAQWVCWVLKPRKNKPGKFDKIPFNPRSRRPALVNDPATWGTFNQAYQACQSSSKFSGIGFVLTSNAHIIGVDLDDCYNPDTNTLLEWAREIIGNLRTYTEISPSGTGIRMFLRGDFKLERNKKGSIEVYSHSRFLTVTGEHFPGTPEEIKTHTMRLAGIFGKDTSRGDKIAAAEEITATIGSLDSEIEKIVEEIEPWMDPHAAPTLAKLEALFNNAPVVKETWEHTRKDTKNWSLSEYDLSLANYFMSAGWTNIEIMFGLIAHRRSRGGDLKMRADYYARTIIACKRGREAEEAQQRLSKESLDEIDEDELRNHILENLSIIYGFEFTGVRRYVSDPPLYEIITSIGAIKGPVNILIDQRTFKQSMAQATAVVTRLVKNKKWDERAQAMLMIATDVELGEEATDIGFGKSLIINYLASRPKPTKFTADVAISGNPFTEGEHTFIITSDLQKFISLQERTRMTPQRLGMVLRAAGLIPLQRVFIIEEVRTSRSIWRLSDDDE